MASRGGVDGLIIHAPRHNDPRLALLRRTGLPFVVHGRFSHEDDSYSWMDMDNSAAFAEATRQVLEFGHKRIALVNGLADMDFAQRRTQGYALALTERGLHPDPSLIHYGEMTEEHGFAATDELLASADPPTAFIASSWLIALGIERAVLTRGLKLGHDISLVTHDDKLSYFAGGQSPRFAAIVSAIADHGRAVSEMLLDLIANPDSGPLHRRLNAHFEHGPSLGPAR